MAGTCVFCGAGGKMSREHVFGDWLSKIGLDLTPVPHVSGALNRVGQDKGISPPFLRTVRDVCGPCNNGWMSDLEGVAQRVLTPFIHGEAGSISVQDQGALAAWTQKTALVAMLVSSDGEREHGYGLPSSEYEVLYAVKDQMVPLAASRFWIGRYRPGRTLASTRVTPLVHAGPGIPPRVEPDGYLITIIVGQVLLCGVRLTSPDQTVDVDTHLQLPVLWPSRGPVAWPDGTALTDARYFRFADGRDLKPATPGQGLTRWLPASDLPQSRLVGGAIELPLACGHHVARYPSQLAIAAQNGHCSVFVVSCDCDQGYLVRAGVDGARCKASGPLTDIQTQYAAMPGAQRKINFEGGVFVYKMLQTGP